ncbi:hypothetical protein [Olleya sp. HaHaR_3_96]|uniref:hypothetical protein n=1 Tax=Olleya sp. HaHaR_3_96 TaxID=2745560 RepID=UPI001C4FE24C|nr:hypothetical protein [Olleya sp. HaHaR_3_96]QXP60055.1 hypothetical protein H0I26_19450 [Olleya sp. HaHaR_3_96]
MRYATFLLFALCLNTIHAQQNVVKNTNPIDYLQVTRYGLNSEVLTIENKIDSNKEFIQINYNQIISSTKNFKCLQPKKTDVLFFYGINPRTNKSNMSFKLSANIKKIYKIKDNKQLIQVIKVFEYNIFPENRFTTSEVYASL